VSNVSCVRASRHSFRAESRAHIESIIISAVWRKTRWETTVCLKSTLF